MTLDGCFWTVQDDNVIRFLTIKISFGILLNVTLNISYYRISKNSQVRTYGLYRASMIRRSLGIRTQRIFNNLIKQNQKLASDFVLKPLTIGSSAQSPEPNVQIVGSNVQRLTSSVESPGSSVQSPAFNSCVQSREIPVCHLVIGNFDWKIGIFQQTVVRSLLYP